MGTKFPTVVTLLLIYVATVFATCRKDCSRTKQKKNEINNICIDVFDL